MHGDELIYIIAYDIEKDKIRNYLSKYLLRNGAIRIQKSLFLAKWKKSIYKNVKQDFLTLNDLYKSNDTIILMPLATDMFQNFFCIGKNLQLEAVAENIHTFFI